MVLAATVVTAVPKMDQKGKDFYNTETGERFQIVGMAYQPGGSSGYDEKTGKDPLSDAEQCKRDAALMQAAGINTIRSYNLNPNVNHDQCASIFNAAGIYMILDVNAPGPGESLTSVNPWESYYDTYLQRIFGVVEAFKGYPNTLAFFSSNEVINAKNTTTFTPAYIRAVTRDLKDYVAKHADRHIPVGYSAADVIEVLYPTFDYLTCDLGKDDTSVADLFALNSYRWCDATSTVQTTGYNYIVSNFTDSPVPVFFSEYGCNVNPPRTWSETVAIMNEMSSALSGGIMYEWTEEDNKYGFVKVNGNELSLLGDYDRAKAKLTNKSDFDWQKLQGQKAEKKDVTGPKCTAKLITVDGFESNFTLPSLPPNGEDLLSKGVTVKYPGKLVKLSDSDLTVKMTVKDSKGNVVKDLKVVQLKDNEFNWGGKTTQNTGTGSGSSSGNSTNSKDDKANSAGLIRPSALAVALPVALPVLAVLFA